MSDSALEWRETSPPPQPKRYVRQPTPLPRRKSLFAEYTIMPVDASYIALAKAARSAASPAEREDRAATPKAGRQPDTDYPPYLVKAFRAGSVAFAIGVIFLLATILFNSDAVRIGGATFLAVGSVTVALALLRGQDLDERN